MVGSINNSWYSQAKIVFHESAFVLQIIKDIQNCPNDCVFLSEVSKDNRRNPER